MPQRMPCKVREVTAHGERVYTVLLEPEGRVPRFSAGQFLHLAIDPYQPGDFWPDSRVFSIASAPSQRELLRITYAVKGAFTARMENELRPGCQVWVKLPYGEFLVDRGKDVCLVAGGTGITAFTALLGELPADHPHQVHLVYGARRPDLLIYRPQAREFGARCAKARVYLFAEELGTADPELHSGRTDIENVWGLLPAPQALTYYIAGPPAMIQALTESLKTKGVDDCGIRIDAWE